MTILALTGVTGHLGSRLATELLGKNLDIRYLARRPEKAPKVAGIPVYQAFYDNSSQTVAALDGVDVLFMVSAKESLTRLQEHKAFIDSAKQAGVRHIVYTSFYRTSPKATFTLSRTHAATERYIKEKGFTYTFIRDNFYTDFFVDLAREYGEIKGPAGNGKVSSVTREDVAKVIAKVLEAPNLWENRILDMTGPEELTLEEMAQLFSKGLGKTVTYIPETVEEAYNSRKAWPAEQWEYDAWVSTYTAIAAGEQAGLSTAIEEVLGRKPISVSEYLKRESR